MPLKVRLKTKERLTINGYTRTYQPGDEVTIGRAIAMRYIQLGKAELSNKGGNGKKAVPPVGKPMAVAANSPGLFPVPENTLLIWDGVIPIPRERLDAGMKLIEKWDLAVPLCDYDTLAMHIGTQEDRDYTQSVIHDLRVPVYETGLMFIQMNTTTQALLEMWQREERQGDEKRLAFLRALYRVKPLILALPHTWVADD